MATEAQGDLPPTPAWDPLSAPQHCSNLYLMYNDLVVLWSKLADFGKFSDLIALSGLSRIMANFFSGHKV